MCIVIFIPLTHAVVHWIGCSKSGAELPSIWMRNLCVE
jgi:hypothetical protein